MSKGNMAFRQFIILVAFLYFSIGCLCTTTSSKCQKANDGNQYTWNFVLPGGQGYQAKALTHMKAINGATTDNVNATEVENGQSPSNVQHDGTNIHCPTQEKCPECPGNGPGIYWREWKGQIPADAIVGGQFATDSGSVPMYLAQAYLPHAGFAGLQPGVLMNGSTSILAVFKGVHTIRANIKVLCGNQDEVVWLPWSETVGLIPSTDFVNAGFERTLDLYFGRSMYKGKQYIGKVIREHKLMYLPYGGRESTLRTFEVLCYRKSVTEKKTKIPEAQAE